MKCHEFRCKWASGEPGDDAARHLDECAECRNYVERELIACGGPMPDRAEPPADLRSRVLQEIVRGVQAPPRRQRWWLIAAAAAAVLFFLHYGDRWTESHTTPNGGLQAPAPPTPSAQIMAELQFPAVQPPRIYTDTRDGMRDVAQNVMGNIEGAARVLGAETLAMAPSDKRDTNE